MPAGLLDLPTRSEGLELVDWIEQSMLLGAVDEQPRIAIVDEFATADPPDDSDVEFAVAEIRRRAAVAPESYPFSTAEDEQVILLARGGRREAYELLVMLSRPDAPWRSNGRHVEAEAHFSVIVEQAARSLFVGARAVRFSRPNVDGRPEQLREAIPWLARQIGVDHGDLGALSEGALDPGVDVVAFTGGGGHAEFIRTTLDVSRHRPRGDVARDALAQMLGFTTTPSARLAVPFALVAEEFARLGLATLDRIALCRCVPARQLASLGAWTPMREFARSEREELVRRMSAPATGTLPDLSRKPRRNRFLED